MKNIRSSQPKPRDSSHSLFHNWVSISKRLLFNSINIQLISNGKDLCCASFIFYVYIAPCFPIFFKRGNRKIAFHIPRNPYQWKWKHKNEATGSARRLIHHCHLSDKRSCNISKDIWYFSPYFIFYSYLYHNFSRNPKPYSAEPWMINCAVLIPLPYIGPPVLYQNSSQLFPAGSLISDVERKTFVCV